MKHRRSRHDSVGVDGDTRQVSGAGRVPDGSQGKARLKTCYLRTVQGERDRSAGVVGRQNTA
jgi:hypothetical protein